MSNLIRPPDHLSGLCPGPHRGTSSVPQLTLTWPLLENSWIHRCEPHSLLNSGYAYDCWELEVLRWCLNDSTEGAEMTPLERSLLSRYWRRQPKMLGYWYSLIRNEHVRSVDSSISECTKMQERPNPPPPTQNASRKSSGEVKIRKLGWKMV